MRKPAFLASALPSLPVFAGRLIGGVGSVAAKAGRVATGAALPWLCPGCRVPVADRGLCAACWSQLSFITPPYCQRLGLPFAFSVGEQTLSEEAIARPPAFHRARAAVRYEGVAPRLVHDFKYGDRLDLAPLLGGLMVRAGAPLLTDAEVLVPVPLHWRRLMSRRFNQSAELARILARDTGLPVLPQALTRRRATAQQVGLSRSARASNVQGAFAVPDDARGAIHGRRLILVDDVLTTGATVEACARALTRAGAARVDVLTFARVVDPATTPI